MSIKQHRPDADRARSALPKLEVRHVQHVSEPPPEGARWAVRYIAVNAMDPEGGEDGMPLTTCKFFRTHEAAVAYAFNFTSRLSVSKEPIR